MVNDFVPTYTRTSFDRRRRYAGNAGDSVVVLSDRRKATSLGIVIPRTMPLEILELPADLFS